MASRTAGTVNCINLMMVNTHNGIDRYLTESNDLFIECVEAKSKKENRKKISKKKKTKTILETIPNKVQITDNRHDETVLSRRDNPKRWKKLHSANNKLGE